ncbi:MAG: ROK family protein [Syntrophomonadaceae bacterium]|nr:ROK family protein [Syntrophomonadaceae bacterium]
MASRILAIDIGGTKVLMGLLDERGRVHSRRQEPVAPERDAAACLEQIARMGMSLLDEAGVRPTELLGVAAAAPGPIDFAQGVVPATPNLNWSGLALRRELSAIFGRDVWLDNDANLAAWGEYCFAAPEGCRDMIYITVSTGIGGALIIDGALYRGVSGGAGELGHMVMIPDGPPCGCGGHGCLEAVASGTALSRELAARLAAGGAQHISALAPAGQTPGPPEIAAAARNGDPEALALLQPVTRYLGAAIAGLVNVFNPQLITIGGGIGLNMADLLLPAIRHAVSRHCFSLHQNHLHIRTTSLGSDIVLKGAAAAILRARA